MDDDHKDEEMEDDNNVVHFQNPQNGKKHLPAIRLPRSQRQKMLDLLYVYSRNTLKEYTLYEHFSL
jgi:hypothetical protein